MHRLIRFIVEANSAKEARDVAGEQLFFLIEKDIGGIDYGTFFDETSTISGASRWGKRKVAVPLLSPTGIKYVLEGVCFDWLDFKEAFERAQEAMSKGVDKLYEDGMGKYALRRVAENQFVFCEHSFVDREELEFFLNENFDEENLWVVPCDVHY